MSDELENIEPTEDKPKRKYVRKTFVGNDKWDDAINSEVEAAAHDVIDEADIDIIDPEDGVEVEDIEPTQDYKPKFLGEEPPVTSFAAMVKKESSAGCHIRLTPWKGKDMWTCDKCRRTSFDKKWKRKHYCS